MGPVSVLVEALHAQDPNKVYRWDYMKGEYGPFTQAGADRNYAAVGVTPVTYGAAGMESWGQTCGVALAAATVCQMVGKRPQINEVFSAYGQINHPMDEVGNSEWLKNSVAANWPKPTYPVPGSDLGSLQCHNALEKFNKAVLKGEAAGTIPVIANYTRSDGCARLCADLAYITIKVLDKQFNGTAGYVTPPVSTLGATCAVSACHGAGRSCDARGVIGKENCVVCHK